MCVCVCVCVVCVCVCGVCVCVVWCVCVCVCVMHVFVTDNGDDDDDDDCIMDSCMKLTSKHVLGFLRREPSITYALSRTLPSSDFYARDLNTCSSLLPVVNITFV